MCVPREDTIQYILEMIRIRNPVQDPDNDLVINGINCIDKCIAWLQEWYVSLGSQGVISVTQMSGTMWHCDTLSSRGQPDGV